MNYFATQCIATGDCTDIGDLGSDNNAEQINEWDV